MTALGDDKAPLEADLRRRFPAAALIAEDAGLRHWAERIVRFITAPEQPDLPLDIRGTAFQARVWRALQKVPPGKTASYTEIAAALGQPKAVRAVAAACAANKLALIVPCHRVVRSDGELAGYRWGSSASARCSRGSAPQSRRRRPMRRQPARPVAGRSIGCIVESLDERGYAVTAAVADRRRVPRARRAL